MQQQTQQKIKAADIAAYLRSLDPEGYKDYTDLELADAANQTMPEFKGMVDLAPDLPQTVPMRFMQPIANAWNPKLMLEGGVQAVTHPVKSILDPLIAQRQLGRQRMQEGDQSTDLWDKIKGYASGVGHMAASVIPIAGPMVANVSSRFADGDIAGGLGEITALASQAIIPEALAPTTPVRRLQEAIHEGGKRAGAGLTNIGLRPSTAVTRDFGNIGRTLIDEDIPLSKDAIASRYANVESELQNNAAALQGTRSPWELADKAYDFSLKEGELGARTRDQIPKINELLDIDMGYRFSPNNYDILGPIPLDGKNLLDVNRAAKHTLSWSDRAVANPSRMEPIYDRGMVFGSRDMLDDMFMKENMPTAVDQLKREQGLMGLQKAHENYLDRPSGSRHVWEALTAAGGLATGHAGAGLATAAAMEALNNARLMSGLGRGIAKVTKPSNQLRALQAAIMSSHNAKNDY